MDIIQEAKEHLECYKNNEGLTSPSLEIIKGLVERIEDDKQPTHYDAGEALSKVANRMKESSN